MEKTQTDPVDTSNPAYRHGHAGRGKFSPEYHSWASMWQRCTNPSRRSYEYYGGKGVTVCPEWKDFTVFLADMGARPPNTSLDRVDVSGGYSKENCRWADSVTQARNSVQVVWVELNGERRRLVEWCEVLGMSINTVRARTKRGMNYPEALTTPILSPLDSARHLNKVRKPKRR